MSEEILVVVVESELRICVHVCVVLSETNPPGWWQSGRLCPGRSLRQTPEGPWDKHKEDERERGDVRCKNKNPTCGEESFITPLRLFAVFNESISWLHY